MSFQGMAVVLHVPYAASPSGDVRGVAWIIPDGETA